MNKINITLVVLWLISSCTISYVAGSLQTENRYQKEAVSLDLAQYDSKTKAFGFITEKQSCKTSKMVKQDIPSIKLSTDKVLKEMVGRID